MKRSNGGCFVGAPDGVADREKIGSRGDERRAIGGGYSADRDARQLEHRRPEFEQLEIGSVFAHLRLAREERAEGDVVGPRLARLHRQMAAGVTRHADLSLSSEPL